MPAQVIKIGGARQHNLKNLHVEIPREKLVVITGLSGSGKSSLAFDTLYAEGQRRYVESLSAYVRQFLDQMEKPDVDFIEACRLPLPSNNAALARIHDRQSRPRLRSTITCGSSFPQWVNRTIRSPVGRSAAKRLSKSSIK